MTLKLSSIHPELQSAAKTMPALQFNKGNLPFMRLLFKLPFLLPKKHPDVQIEEHTVQSIDMKSRLRLRVYKPKNASTTLPVLLWFHGGGHIVGNLNQSDDYSLLFSRELGIAVVAVDYRLSPEWPFPASLEDAYCALKWVHDQANLLGITPKRIAVGGESAGAGLAASLSQLAFDRKEVKLAFQLLVYPMLDDRTKAKPGETDKDFLVWTPSANYFGWESYLQQTPGSASVPPGSVPARREDLSGLAPAWIGVGTLDLFHDEDVAYAKRLQACGVDCELVTVPGAFHGFDSANPNLPVARAFRRSMINVLKKHLFPSVS